MPKPDKTNNTKNLIAQNLIALRQQNGLSQRDLAEQLQHAGYDMSKNTITRIETGQRYVSDIELRAFKEIFNTTYEELPSQSE